MISSFVYDSVDASNRMFKSLNHMAEIIKYRKPWGFRPFLSNIQKSTEHLWIIKSLSKRKLKITLTQATTRIFKYAKDTTLNKLFSH